MGGKKGVGLGEGRKRREGVMCIIKFSLEKPMVPSGISEQATEGFEDDPVSQRSQGSSDEHERGLQIVRNLFDGCCLWQAESSFNTYCLYQQFELCLSVVDII